MVALGGFQQRGRACTFPSNIASEMPKLLISKFNLVLVRKRKEDQHDLMQNALHVRACINTKNLYRRILCHLLLMNKAGEEASRCERMPRMLALVWAFLADGDFNIGWVALT